MKNETKKNSKEKMNKTKKVYKRKTNGITMKRIGEFKSIGIHFLDKCSEKELERMVKVANDAYYNEQSLLTDNEFDILKEYIERKYPNNKKVKEIGAPIKKDKVKLPYFMASMNKIKPTTDALSKWKQAYKGPYVISAKLDGISGLYTCNDNVKKLFTRGDGEYGQNISHLIPYLRLPEVNNSAVRGEFIITKHNFDTHFKATFSNSRNFVSGVINSKKVNKDVVQYIDFVAYEVIEPSLTPNEQMKFMKHEKFLPVKNMFVIPEQLSNEYLSDILVKWRESYDYTIDGIICTHDTIVERVKKNPEHSFAFKMVLSDQVAEAKVLEVIWNASKDGYLKPKIRIEPLQLGGVTIEYATAFNAKFVEENKLGFGSIVKLVRSGDVIPHILEVTEQTNANMPKMEYEWTKNHVDIVLKNKDDNEQVVLKNITGFFTILKVDGLSVGNVIKLYKAGYNDVPSILKMKADDFEKIEGFKEKMSAKVFNSIQEKIAGATVAQLAVASNMFGHGMGLKKAELILKECPKILQSNDNREDKINQLKTIKSMAEKSAILFVDGIFPFMEFLEKTGLTYKVEQIANVENENNEEKEKASNGNKNHPLFDKHIVMTGFREKELQEKLEKHYSVTFSSSVSKNTLLVIVKTKDIGPNKKVDEANKRNIPVLSLEEFKVQYNL
jgi:NAD-dependent DNA ligase